MPATVRSLELYREKKRTRKGSGGGDEIVGEAIEKGLYDRTLAELDARFSDPQDEKEHRARALLSTWMETGLRVSELLRLRLAGEDQDCKAWRAEDGALVCRMKSKGAKRRHTVTITPDAEKHVRAYHNFSGIDGPHFFWSLPLKNKAGKRSRITRQGLWAVLKEWGVQTIEGRTLHPHAFRHAVGRLVAREHDLREAQKLLGHTSFATTARYYSTPNLAASKLQWREYIKPEGKDQ